MLPIVTWVVHVLSQAAKKQCLAAGCFSIPPRHDVPTTWVTAVLWAENDDARAADPLSGLAPFTTSPPC